MGLKSIFTFHIYRVLEVKEVCRSYGSSALYLTTVFPLIGPSPE